MRKLLLLSIFLLGQNCFADDSDDEEYQPGLTRKLIGQTLAAAQNRIVQNQRLAIVVRTGVPQGRLPQVQVRSLQRQSINS